MNPNLQGAAILGRNQPFKDHCLRAMKNMYPQGVETAQQHRDVIRIYVCGWGDALMALGSKLALAAFAREVGRIANDPNWWPDNTWCWWA